MKVTVNKHKLNTLVKIKGEGVTEATIEQTLNQQQVISMLKQMVLIHLEVQLAKDLKGLNSAEFKNATGDVTKSLQQVLKLIKRITLIKMVQLKIQIKLCQSLMLA